LPEHGTLNLLIQVLSGLQSTYLDRFSGIVFKNEAQWIPHLCAF
jgi:hypothetical protein